MKTLGYVANHTSSSPKADIWLCDCWRVKWVVIGLGQSRGVGSMPSVSCGSRRNTKCSVRWSLRAPSSRPGRGSNLVASARPTIDVRPHALGQDDAVRGRIEGVEVSHGEVSSSDTPSAIRVRSRFAPTHEAGGLVTSRRSNLSAPGQAEDACNWRYLDEHDTTRRL